ncbi:MAG TPA: hypothetical protein VK530_08180 [Candidatus Acidoferrum sp.]|nr:hypothetical protein [Candidatus Acidoferrum sp.]
MNFDQTHRPDYASVVFAFAKSANLLVTFASHGNFWNDQVDLMSNS